MKVENKIVKSGPAVVQGNVVWINFNDKAIHKLFIKSGNRITVKFKNVKVSYLNGLILRYSPLTQRKLFYLKYKYKGKSHWLKLNEFILDHYGTVEVSEELLNLYKKYYDRKKGLWKHDHNEQLITQRELEKLKHTKKKENPKIHQQLLRIKTPMIPLRKSFKMQKWNT